VSPETTTTTTTTTKMAPEARAPTLVGRLRAAAVGALPEAVLVRHGPRRGGGRRVALTFDDGPHELSPRYLEVLARHGARATFFVMGSASVERRQTLLDMVAEGHEVSSHGFSHRPFPSLSAAELDDELDRTAEVLPPPRTRRPLVRPPYGALSPLSLLRCARAGYTSVMWSLDSDDCRTSVPAEVAARLRPEAVAPGDIVLMHDGQPWTLAALPEILGNLGAAGFQLVPVGELLED
jgi:peptidoglycan-N-acetylglucosamine deacetylase